MDVKELANCSTARSLSRRTPNTSWKAPDNLHRRQKGVLKILEVLAIPSSVDIRLYIIDARASPLLFDIGGGKSHDVQAFHKSFPEMGRIVL